MLDLVKCVNEGTRRMRDEMLEMGLPQPQFVQQEVGHTQVRVTLGTNSKQRRQWVDKDVIEILGEREASKLTEHEKRVVNYIAEYGRINVSQA
jgi:predicted HTH transcriptional regulator